MTDIVELALLTGSLSHLRDFCRAHQFPPGHCRCESCPLQDACAELNYADSLGEFCTIAIESIRDSEAMRRREP